MSNLMNIVGPVIHREGKGPACRARGVATAGEASNPGPANEGNDGAAFVINHA